MRDVVVFLIFGIGIFFAVKSPYYGVLLWSLFNYMNPHRLTWGPAYNFPFVYIIAIVTIFSFLASREKRPITVSAPLVLWILFLLWMGTTTIFALEPDRAEEQLIKVIKIQVPVLMTLFLFYEKKRLDVLLSVIAFSIGFYGVKGGVFTLVTGGSYIVWGPPGSFIYGNNELAVALLTVVPLLFYLRKHVVQNIWGQRLLLVAVVLMVVSAIGTQSRGAFLALLALGGYFWWRSDRKMVWAVGIAVVAISIWLATPASWKDRMSTIQSYQEDSSAQGRLRAWEFAYDLANSRFTGGGFNPWNKRNYLAFSKNFVPNQTAFVAHSIYFSVLGEHGWLGLILYLLVLGLTWRRLGRVIRNNRKDPGRLWMADLADSLRIGMVAYFVGGAFLSLAYFDLPWHFVAIGLILTSLDSERGRNEADASNHVRSASRLSVGAIGRRMVDVRRGETR